MPPPAHLWSDLLDDADRDRLANAKFARRSGLGSRVAILVIDAQNYMVGPLSADDDTSYPSSCGEAGRAAVGSIARLIEAGRRAGAAVIYTTFELAKDGSDMGGYARKRDLLDIEGWCIEGTTGARMVDTLTPGPGEISLVKKKPSAFFGTPVQAYLTDRGIDTVIVVGGATSNCVRATCVDAASANYRVIVPAECVFDRFEISHKTALFDLDRQYGDVVALDDLVGVLESRAGEST